MPLRIVSLGSESYGWKLVDDRGRVVAECAHAYVARTAAVADAERFRTEAPDAPVVSEATPADDGDDEPAGSAFRVRGRQDAYVWEFTDGDGLLAQASVSFDGAAAVELEVERVRTILRATPSVERSPEAFDPERLTYAVVTAPLKEAVAREAPNKGHRVIIELNRDYANGIETAKADVRRWVVDIAAGEGGRQARPDLGLRRIQTELSQRYVIASLTGRQITDLVRRDSENAEVLTEVLARRAPAEESDRPKARPRTSRRAIYRIWPDFPVHALLTSSVRTVKADAARASFAAAGEGVVWAIVDSGIDGAHPHFQTHGTLDLPGSLSHRDFVNLDDEKPLEDPAGHGTHVAGIIAGETGRKTNSETGGEQFNQLEREPGETGLPQFAARPVGSITGVAPKCKLLSLRVLDRDGNGHVSDVIAALQTVYDANRGGRDLHVHGVNLSVGYEFDPEWYACGHSPLCQEVDLLVRTGVVVVAAAGNTGYGTNQADARITKAGLDLSINDPGNAESAITVGATHRDAPHRYGVSYFSSKGPTSDGRAKPDLVAPGERVLSCAAGQKRDAAVGRLRASPAPGADPTADVHYVADSGTSMAAPHVSGAVAAFLSVRPEFIGRSDDVKALFLRTATDLGRDRYFQGHGLVDLMRALQDV